MCGLCGGFYELDPYPAEGGYGPLGVAPAEHYLLRPGSSPLSARTQERPSNPLPEARSVKKGATCGVGLAGHGNEESQVSLFF
jgi:hypothetical protein